MMTVYVVLFATSWFVFLTPIFVVGGVGVGDGGGAAAAGAADAAGTAGAGGAAAAAAVRKDLE